MIQTTSDDVNRQIEMAFAAFILLGLLSPWPATFGCTVFTATNETTTLVGNNEDMFHAKSKVEFHSSTDGEYGRVFFGMGHNLHQGGMNEKGLFFDCVATGPAERTLPKTKPECPGGLVERAMEDCAAIQEVIELFDQYDSTYMNSYVTIFVDASGEGLVAQRGTVCRKDKGIFAVGRGEKAAIQRLEQSSEISMDLFRSIVSDVHVEGVVKTLYSNVYDLRSQVIDLYYYYDFENPLQINLQDHLERRGTCTLELADLFPEREAQIKNDLKALSEKHWKSAARMDSAQFDKYAGSYVGQGIEIEVAEVNGRYEIRFLGTEPYELVPLSQVEFAVIDVSDSNARVKFVKQIWSTGPFQLEADLDGWILEAERESK